MPVQTFTSAESDDPASCSGHSFKVLCQLPNARPFNEKASACSHV